ncbi:MAG: (2Fe-2S)-binding protein [Planctomycetes bacterium]|nr:(2Fe-2S)-binding protein [Planctomycetota bacterium]
MRDLQERPPASGFSRREFLKGSSAVAAASLATQEAIGQEKEQRAAVTSGWTEITLDVNGVKEKVKVEPRTTLLEVLRYQLDLTGAKPVSLDGSSGCSTVLVDGKPISASTTLAVAVKDKKIRTVESFGGPHPDPVCTAFVEYDAQQCGFCTPGFVVAVRAFLDKNPDATEEEIRSGLNGNLCRCGTYAQIVQAALDVVQSTEQ